MEVFVVSDDFSVIAVYSKWDTVNTVFGTKLTMADVENMKISGASIKLRGIDNCSYKVCVKEIDN